MKYTMTNKKSTITLDTVTGDISGDTYSMREIIKSDLYATWDKVRKVWHSDNLDDTIEKYRSYLTRCYKLEAVEEPTTEAVEAADVKPDATTNTTKSTVSTESQNTKTVAHTELVNGNDGFYQVVRYTDGTIRKVFVG